MYVILWTEGEISESCKWRLFTSTQSNSENLDLRFQIIVSGIALHNVCSKNTNLSNEYSNTTTVSSVTCAECTYNALGVDSELKVQGP